MAAGFADFTGAMMVVTVVAMIMMVMRVMLMAMVIVMIVVMVARGVIVGMRCMDMTAV